ncbi:MAG: hypothetical protein FWD67_11125 [Betaproteobacteria bacterium]|nr:hypothetical protein [Betaproteobacteria bacterium]
MPFMPWSDEFVLGIDSIDKQHRWLVETTNRLYDELGSYCSGQKELKKVLPRAPYLEQRLFVL